MRSESYPKPLIWNIEAYVPVYVLGVHERDQTYRAYFLVHSRAVSS